MVANGKLPASDLVAVTGVVVSKNTALALKNAIADAKWRIEIVKPAGGYRSYSVQDAMRKASIGTSIAAKQKWNLSTSSTKPLAYPGGSSHGWGTRVDLKFNGSDNPSTEQINFMNKYGFTREFGASDRNHFMHDGKTAIKRVVPSKEKPLAIEGIDYSYSRPTAAQIKAAGKKFVVRYITTPGKGNKGIDQAEYDALKKAGIEVVAVYEGGAADMKKGKSQGIADAKDALVGLKRIVGLNDNLPVYFACDFDATPSDQTKINEYLDGAASVIGLNRVGIYGGYYPVKRAKDAKKATWLWQTYAWSGGQILDGIHLYQYKNGVKLGSGQVDLTRAFKTEYGQTGIKPVSTPTLKPVEDSDTPKVEVEQVMKPDTELHAEQSAVMLAAPIYFKGEAKAEIWVLMPYSGSKRHITSAEWTIIKASGQDKFSVQPQEIVDLIPTAS